MKKWEKNACCGKRVNSCGKRKFVHDEVKAWVHSNAGVLFRSRRCFVKAVYQEELAALRPLTPFPPLNSVLILPDGDEEIMREMFKQFLTKWRRRAVS